MVEVVVPLAGGEECPTKIRNKRGRTGAEAVVEEESRVEETW